MRHLPVHISRLALLLVTFGCTSTDPGALRPDEFRFQVSGASFFGSVVGDSARWWVSPGGPFSATMSFVSTGGTGPLPGTLTLALVSTDSSLHGYSLSPGQYTIGSSTTGFEGTVYGPLYTFDADSGRLIVRPSSADSLLEGSLDVWFHEASGSSRRTYRFFGTYRAIPTTGPPTVHAL